MMTFLCTHLYFVVTLLNFQLYFKFCVFYVQLICALRTHTIYAHTIVWHLFPSLMLMNDD